MTDLPDGLSTGDGAAPDVAAAAPEAPARLDALTPRQIVAELDKYVVGQTDAKRSVAVALRNRWRRLNSPPAIRDEIVPANILMIGPTGVGKTEIARRLAKLTDAPFVKVEATKFTEVGYVGRDVESMIRDLVDGAVTQAREAQAERAKGAAEAAAEERLLDLLLPPAPRPATPAFGFSPPAEAPETDTPEGRTRAKLREKLRDGALDNREVEVDVTLDKTANLQMFGPMGLEEMGINLQDMLGGMGKTRKTRRVKVPEAKALLAAEEAQKLVDGEAAKEEAIARVEQAGIVFIDEIDKVAGRQGPGGSGPDVSREGVQRDLLPIVEGSTVTTKHGPVRTDHVLFIASGAFHVSKPSDLIPELQGRFPIRVELTSLGEDDFVRILTEPENALLTQYAALFASEGVGLEFDEAAVREIARVATDVNESVENIGARRLHTILTTLLDEFLFEVPDAYAGETIRITADDVRERLSSIAQNRDLSQYVL
ncbi:MAG TPA: ATP-dependent protease ATPase subunit HslU [Rubricoccaceae bacterium]